MKYKLKTIYPLSALTLAMALSSGQSFAAEAQVNSDNDQTETKTAQQTEEKVARKDTLFETIQITAQKREASIQSTPISVTAISGDVLDQMGITNMDDFQFFAPGITITNDSMAIINIRGVGTTAFGVATDPRGC